MIKPFPEDKVGARLRELGFEVRDYKATTSPHDREVLGKVFVKDNTEITYSYGDQDTSTLIIGFYRLLKKKPGLSNPFAASLWFLDFLKNENVGVKRVTCTIKIINTDYKNPLSPPKIIRFCTKIMGGHITRGPTLIPWYVLELKDYKGMRFYKKESSMSLQSSLSKKK